MARKPSICGLLSLLVLAYLEAALATSLPNDISRFIPDCAQECFITFLVITYGTGQDGDLPSLDYLCSNYGNSEFTVGEGAVQCLAAEKSVGLCSQMEADATVIYRALQMCSGQPNAIQPTHGVITATLLLPPPGGSGVVSFPPPRSTQTRTRTTRAPSKTSDSPFVVDSTTLSFSSPTAIEGSTFTTSVRTSRTQYSSTETSTATAVPAGAVDGKGSLTAGQKAGISVGVVAVAGLAVGLLFLLRHHRRKNNTTRKHGSESTEALHKRDTWGYKVEKRYSSGGNSWTVQPTPPRKGPDSPSPRPPRAYNRASWRPSAIGLAITPTHPPPNPQTTPSRRVSKLLPAKPVLALGVPQKPSPLLHEMTPPRQLRVVQPSPASSRNKPRPPLPLKLEIPKQADFRTMLGGSKLGQGRESAMTEFEEDGRTSLSPEGQIWKPPSAAPPSTTTTYYVSDKYGNWVLGDPQRISHVAELDAATPMTTTTPKPGIANAVLLPVAQRAQKVESKSPRLVEEPKEMAAARTHTAKVDGQSNVESRELQQVMPRPLFSANPNPRLSASARRSSARSMNRPRVTSADSGVTTFTNASEELDDLQPPAPPPLSLSPVAESPRAGTGRSPVSYPRIHGRKGGPAAAGKPAIVAPPQRPILLQPPGQPSPTLGLQQSSASNGPGLSSYSGHRGGRRGVQIENPALPRTGSPTVRLVEPSPSPPPDDRSQLPSARHRSPSVNLSPSFQQQPRPQLQPSPFPPEQPYQHQQLQQRQEERQQPRQLQPSERQQPRRPPGNWVPGLPAHPHPQRRPQQRNSHWHPQQRHYQQYHYQHHQPRLRTHPLPYPDPHGRPPQPHHSRQQSLPMPGGYQQHQRSNSASIITKRLGTERAAGMAISTATTVDANPSSLPSSWRREGGGPICPSPELVTPRPQTPGNLPATPTWVPRLTPTRRGEDLYLNVH